MTVDDPTSAAAWRDTSIPVLDIDSADFPPLHRNGAFPIVQDRWERLVSTVRIAAPVERVWAALTDPEQVGQWFAVCRGTWAVDGAESILDFEDGEFFLCRTVEVRTPESGGRAELRHLWRWVGVGPATSVTWSMTACGPEVTAVTVIEEAVNPPSDWRSWNGMGWPGILDQLADFIRTGVPWRWPWRRMGPYVQTELPGSTFEVWAMLTAVPAMQFWLSRATGSLAEGQTVDIILGDASGVATLQVHRHIEANQQFPSYLPRLEFGLRRPGWPAELSGHLWIEPAGLGRSLLQVFHTGWEALSVVAAPLAERRLLTGFWVGAFGRAEQMAQSQHRPPPVVPGPVTAGAGDDRMPGDAPFGAGPHGWSR